MKKKTNKDLLLLFILIPLFLFCAFYISSKMEDQLPPYAVMNKSQKGCSVFFEALQQLKYPIDRTVNPITSFKKGEIQIVAEGNKFDIGNSEIKNWIEKGGTLVYLTKGDPTLIKYAVVPEIKGHVQTYKYHKGLIIAMDVSAVTNKALTQNTNNAYELLQEIHRHPYERLYFNESHLYSVTDPKSIWDYIPMAIKYILYEVFLLLVTFFYYKGKRFGKIIPIYEEVERSENEYLYSAASLYRQGKCFDLMMEIYYKGFLKKINCTHENWLIYWEKEKMPYFNKAKKVYEFMEFGKNKHKKKEYMQMISLVEELKSNIKQRRDSYWKTLKKTL